jgi:hypothetical protein
MQKSTALFSFLLKICPDSDWRDTPPIDVTLVEKKIMDKLLGLRRGKSSEKI